MSHLVGGNEAVAWVVLKAFLLYVTAIIGFRLGERRTLAEMSPFDFVAAVAVGAIVGRVPNADTSYLAGAATLVAVLVTHTIVTRLRRFPTFARLIAHSPRLLVVRGRVLENEVRKCGLTLSDLYGLLRQRGVEDLGEVRYVIFEQRGRVSVIRESEHEDGARDLIRDVMAQTSAQK
ncbi:MAG: YetF domain-containing protein [Phycisphaerales bacterium]|jgi:uncharacterized membrane protein YcaP (DUF421 family)